MDELELYRDGMSIPELSGRFRTYHRTSMAHLARRSVPLRKRELDPTQVDEAVDLYDDGLTLMEIGRKFGVSKGEHGGPWQPRA